MKKLISRFRGNSNTSAKTLLKLLASAADIQSQSVADVTLMTAISK